MNSPLLARVGAVEAFVPLTAVTRDNDHHPPAVGLARPQVIDSAILIGEDSLFLVWSALRTGDLA